MGYLDNMSDSSINNYMRKNISSKGIPNPATLSDSELDDLLFKRAVTRRGNSLEEALRERSGLFGQSESAISGGKAYDLSKLWYHNRTLFIQVLWMDGQAKGMSETEIMERIYNYYRVKGIEKDTAYRDIEKRLRDLRDKGRI